MPEEEFPGMCIGEYDASAEECKACLICHECEQETSKRQVTVTADAGNGN